MYADQNPSGNTTDFRSDGSVGSILHGRLTELFLIPASAQLV